MNGRNLSAYRHLTYRRAIDEAVENRKVLPGKFTLRGLAEASGLQPSFLSNVLKERCDFNADQLFAVAKHLNFSEAENDYLVLLLEHERSLSHERKRHLKEQIDSRRAENLRSEKHLNIKPVELSPDAQAQYYLDPFAQLALVHLSLAPYNSQPAKLTAALGISERHLVELLEILVKIGYVARSDSGYQVLSRDRHLPKTNPLSGPHLALMRLKSIDQLQRLSSDQSYCHSVTFTGTDETRRLLSEAYLGFLKKAEGVVKPAKSEKAFQMNFDLFPWGI